MFSNTITPTKAGFLAAATRESQILAGRMRLMSKAQANGNTRAAEFAAGKVRESIAKISGLLDMAEGDMFPDA